MSQTPGRHTPLSLQDKLDRISHDREVLAQLKDLARHGLNDGDRVQQRDSGTRGRVIVLRSDAIPSLVVQLDDGRQVPFDASWTRAPRT